MKIAPFAQHQVFNEEFEDLKIEDYLLKTLKLINENVKETTQMNVPQYVDFILGNSGVPDLGMDLKKKLKNDIKLSKQITSIMLNLKPEILHKVA